MKNYNLSEFELYSLLEKLYETNMLFTYLKKGNKEDDYLIDDNIHFNKQVIDMLIYKVKEYHEEKSDLLSE